jgi:hypothetical protein
VDLPAYRLRGTARLHSLAVIALEPTRRRKQLMAPFALIGTLIAAILLAAMVRGPVSVKLALYHLSYSIRLPDGFLIVALYVVAVCGPLLVSGYRNVALFGVVNLVAAITLHCRFAKPHPHQARSGSGGLMSVS